MGKERPDPEVLLKEIMSEEEKKGQGKLKIFFGYAAGVGKTYRMLKYAHQMKKEGKDVVIGYLEPHARPETARLAEGLECVPVKEVQHNQITLKEMDLDGVLKRRPEMVLVDEYAHTNAPLCRHQKRYQDVAELLKAGIHVCTTVNVQHIESLCDIVASITGVVMRERIPDSAFDQADEVELVDIEPEDLLKRLEEGKVYKKKQAQYAMHHFFTIEKLTALREIALRRTADHVNIIAEKTKKRAGGEYYTEEKILVGISPSPSNEKIIRTAARMAKAFDGSLIGLYVENQNSESMNEADKMRLKEHLHLAEKLGAKIETVCGNDIPFLIAEYARASGVSKIVTGRSAPSTGIIRKPNFTDKLELYAPDMDLYVIPNQKTANCKRKLKKDGGLHRYVKALFIGMLFMAISWVAGLGKWAWIALPVAFFVSALIMRMREQVKELARAAYRTKIILDTNQALQNCKDEEEIGATLAEQLQKVLERKIVYYGCGSDQLKPPVIYTTNGAVSTEEEALLINENEKAVAQWVYKNRKRAGATTRTLTDSACYYLAVRNLETVYGVVGIAMGKKEMLSAFEQNVVMALLAEAATVMEREILRTKNKG